VSTNIWFGGSINVQSCKSKRNWLQYIMKEDDNRYITCLFHGLASGQGLLTGVEVHRFFRYWIHLLFHTDIRINICVSCMERFEKNLRVPLILRGGYKGLNSLGGGGGAGGPPPSAG
jgi:hypothetical protein